MKITFFIGNEILPFLLEKRFDFTIIEQREKISIIEIEASQYILNDLFYVGMNYGIQKAFASIRKEPA
jgi:hypothetical protein